MVFVNSLYFGFVGTRSLADSDHVQIVSSLIAANADVNYKDGNSSTALMFAAAAGSSEDPLAHFNSFVLNLIFFFFFFFFFFFSLLHIINEGHTSVVKLLVENGADVDAQNNRGFTPLMFACTRSHVQTVREIVQAGADLGVYHHILVYRCNLVKKKKNDIFSKTLSLKTKRMFTGKMP